MTSLPANQTEQTEIVAEIGQAHDGSLDILHSLIDAIAPTGVTTIKFQVHIAEAESSILEPFRIKFSRRDASRYDYWKRMEFTTEQWQGIKNHCAGARVNFLASPFSCAAVNLLEKIGTERYKIGSGELTNSLMLDRIKETQKPLLASTGLATSSEIERILKDLDANGTHYTLLECTSAYPTKFKDINLSRMLWYKNTYRCRVGLSDHSGTIWPSLAATSLGAAVIEVHATFDRRMHGPDTTSSLTVDELKQLSEGVKAINAINNHSSEHCNKTLENPLRKIFGKSLAVNKTLPKGHVLCRSDLESKKPAHAGIPAAKYSTVVGRKLKHPLNKWAFINNEDLE